MWIRSSYFLSHIRAADYDLKVGSGATEEN